MTNEQKLKKLLKELSSLETALLCERILLITEITLKDIEKNPAEWDKTFINKCLYEGLCNKIKLHLNYN